MEFTAKFEEYQQDPEGWESQTKVSDDPGIPPELDGPRPETQEVRALKDHVIFVILVGLVFVGCGVWIYAELHDGFLFRLYAAIVGTMGLFWNFVTSRKAVEAAGTQRAPVRKRLVMVVTVALICTLWILLFAFIQAELW